MDAIYSPDHRMHDATEQVEFGRRWPMNECPQRAENIHAALTADARFTMLPPDTFGLDPITAVHDPALVAYLATAWREYIDALGSDHGSVLDAVADTYRHPAMNEGMPAFREPPGPLGRLGYWCFDTTTPLMEGTYQAARSAVDVAVTATHRVLHGQRAAYGLCRPPGHHAPVAGFGGYCYFNNAAIAAQRALDDGVAKVTILDVDYHHGNGTQQIFWSRPDVQYVSLHGDPTRAYPYFCGFDDEVGEGRGRQTNLNLTLPPQCNDETYARRLETAIDAIAAFTPEILIVSLGVDTYRNDPLGDLDITTASYAQQGAMVRELGLPTVVLQEGGYDVATIGTNVVTWLAALGYA
jgi:acetoin utilization deacetylase AcuC-like enzyme